MPQECLVELKPASSSHNLLVVDELPGIGTLIQCESLSDLGRLLRITAYVLRPVKRFKLCGKNFSSIPTGAISPQEIAVNTLVVTLSKEDCPTKGLSRC